MYHIHASMMRKLEVLRLEVLRVRLKHIVRLRCDEIFSLVRRPEGSLVQRKELKWNRDKEALLHSARAVNIVSGEDESHDVQSWRCCHRDQFDALSVSCNVFGAES